MAQGGIKIIETEEERQVFMTHLLEDIRAFEVMLAEDRFEKDIQRIGAEQEMVLVDQQYNPALIGPELHQALDKDFITTEYARFNLEINLSPLRFSGDCLARMKQELIDKLQLVAAEADKHQAQLILTGILPTIREADTDPEAMTPEPRYQALLKNVNQRRGEQYEFNIKGVDELITRNNPSTFGGCMTSFQVHLQVDPNDLVDQYNWAQLITGPTLACATNSPVFLGRRLWHETRIALLRQTTDTRKPYSNLKQEEARVSFGNAWIESSIAELFHQDIAGYKAYLTRPIAENASEVLDQGGVPRLEALNFHNGTIYRWNRVCYGTTQGAPHLRIENRVLPAGPTVDDEIANTAFWLGLMKGLPERYRHLTEKMPFDQAKENFLKAAQLGIEVQFTWLDGALVTAQELVLDELLPIAERGLQQATVDEADRTYYLDIIRQRTESAKTGSRWILNSYQQLQEQSTQPSEAWIAITAGMLERQTTGRPGHTWSLATVQEAGNWRNRFRTLSQVMTRSLYTVQESDIVDLATHLMTWKQIGHVPVENEGKLVGIITKDSIISYMTEHHGQDIASLPVRDVMVRELVTAPPDMPLTEAIELIVDSEVSCLPVVRDQRLVGLITEHDFVHLSRLLYRELDQQSE
jgi:CBS domain-containing protein/gamma-glutamylcysteine synthetase